MILSAYSKYRLLISLNALDNSNYFAVNEFGLYEDGDHSGINLCTGAAASATSSYNATTTPDKSIDGVPSTYWESNSTDGTKFLQIDLSSAKVVRSIYISSTIYPNEVPKNFKILGSNDGVSWTEIASFTNWVTTATAKSGYEQINLYVGGESKLSTGVRSSRVMLHKWSNGSFLASIVPNTDGSWSYRVSHTDELLVTHTGPSGFQPKSDGPITPYAG